MAYLLPLPYDMQFEIDSMVTSMKMKEVVHELTEVCKEFWQHKKNEAEENYYTHWMWEHQTPIDQIDDWEAMSNDEIDRDLYISKWADGYRFEMCISALMTRDPEEAYFKSLPLP